MTNPQKAKGDRGELEAVEFMVALAPDLVRDNARRLLGAGRREDEGDLYVLHDVSVQVKTWSNVTRACREAADGALAQQRHARTDAHLGMVPIPHATRGLDSLRWLAAVYEVPGGRQKWEPLPTFGVTADAVKHLKSGYPGTVPLALRGCQVRKTGHKTMLLMPMQAWMQCYRQDKGTTAKERQ